MPQPKLVFSKKGFDTSYGKRPSPVLADGRMVSLPIPEARAARTPTYEELRLDGATYGDLLRDLRYPTDPRSHAHLDPDVVEEAQPRGRDWRGAFGQVGTAQGHLSNRGVGPASLFLFWGWFERYEKIVSRGRRDGFSAVYGYLEVEQDVQCDGSSLPSFLHGHPHADSSYRSVSNCIYVARRALSWNPKRPGWGVFKYSPTLRLSVPGESRSVWRLPGFFHPEQGCCLSFLGNERWREPGETTTVLLPGRGQEFVCDFAGEVGEWARALIDQAEIWTPTDSIARPR